MSKRQTNGEKPRTEPKMYFWLKWIPRAHPRINEIFIMLVGRLHLFQNQKVFYQFPDEHTKWTEHFCKRKFITRDLPLWFSNEIRLEMCGHCHWRSFYRFVGVQKFDDKNNKRKWSDRKAIFDNHRLYEKRIKAARKTGSVIWDTHTHTHAHSVCVCLCFDAI